MNKERTFAGIPAEFASAESAAVELICVPYDGTSTWGKGADHGPEAFLEAAENMELYDIETDSEVYRHGIWLAPDVTVNRSPEAMTDEVRRRVDASLASHRMITLFGGEHSISIGSIQGHAAKYKGLTVLQIDAHADLRRTYEGSECNHACALYWARYNTNLLQVGIRSMDVSEKEHMDLSKTWMAHDCHHRPDVEWMSEVLAKCTDHVYITIDLDGFDPSIVPHTGTPEPGGLGWYQVLRLFKALCKTGKVVGFDIVELAANEHSKPSDFLAAKLYYKILSYCFNS
ncbi:MAG: agmatinase [Flavobacteriales bacterium]|nr:agmatinase [Flavobacteriales bacterium]